jgi:hypothetical protein
MVLSVEEVTQLPVVDAVVHAVDTIRTARIEPARLVGEGDLQAAFAEFLKIDVANGDARADTVRTYHVRMQQWVSWFRARGGESPSRVM